MTKQPVGIGIIGTGFGAAVQLPGFLRIPEATVIGVASHQPGRSEALANKHGLPMVFKTPEELIASPDVHLVSIATVPMEHAAFVRAAIQAGKHVLCEKPFTFSVADAEDLFARARSANIVHAVDFEFRELPALQFLHAQMARGSIGSVQSAEFRWIVGTWADRTRPWQWQCDRTQGGGVVGALGVHLFDAAEWLIGPLTVVRAAIGTEIQERPDVAGSMKPVTSEDHATADMQTRSGAAVHVELSNVDPHGGGLGIAIVGDSGSLILESMTAKYATGLRVRDASGTVLFEDAGPPPGGLDSRVPPFQSLAERLVRAIQESDRSFKPSFEEGLRSEILREAVMFPPPLPLPQGGVKKCKIQA